MCAAVPSAATPGPSKATESGCCSDEAGGTSAARTVAPRGAHTGAAGLQCVCAVCGGATGGISGGVTKAVAGTTAAASE